MLIRNTNRLLEALPPDYRQSLMARMEKVSLPVPTMIYRPGETPRYAHFMIAGVMSIVCFMEDGSGVEVGLSGCEGLPEAFHLLGTASLSTTGFMQVEGAASAFRTLTWSASSAALSCCACSFWGRCRPPAWS